MESFSDCKPHCEEGVFFFGSLRQASSFAKPAMVNIQSRLSFAPKNKKGPKAYVRANPEWKARAEAQYGTAKPQLPITINFSCAGCDGPGRAFLEYDYWSYLV